MNRNNITVATVCYNAEHYIRETILSVLESSQYIDEYVIVDGGSKDLTMEIIESYLPKLEEASIVVKSVSEPDDGIYDAMNKAWNLSSDNNHILFLGAGDKVLGLPMNLLRNTVYYGKVYKGTELFNPTTRLGLRLGNSLHHQALLIPKGAIETPFSLDYPTYADYDFNVRLIRSEKYQFMYSDEFVGYALPGGVSEKLLLKEMTQICMRNYGILSGICCYLYCSYQKARHGI